VNSPIRKFFAHFILPRWKIALGLLGSMLFYSGLALPIPVLFRIVIDKLIPEGKLVELAWTAAGLGLIAVLQGLFAFLSQYLTVLGEQTLVADVEKTLIRHLLALPWAFLQDREVGYLMARVRSDTEVAKAFFLGVLTLFDNAVFLCAGAALLFWLDWKLATAAIVLLPSLTLASRSLNRRLQKLAYEIQEADAIASKELEEGLSSILTTKLLHLERWIHSKIAQAIEKLKIADIRTNTVGAMAGGVLTFMVRLGPALFLSVGAWQVIRGQLSLGTVIAFISFIGYLYGPAQAVITTNLGLQRARVAASRILELLEEPAESLGDRPFVVREGRIDVEGVSFAYPNGTLALKNVSLRVEGGTKVALVGQTGSGKSTLLALFVRLFTDYSGTIRIDGQDIREVDLSSLRRQVVLVSQDVFLFSGTVMDNLRCGDSMISEEEILEVTKALGAHEFILALPNGYETQIGERGIKLSGGQKQLLALARAVLRRPKILLLDEATSAMDSETEARVWRALDSLLPGCTVILAAHRLATVQSADRIFVLKEGRLVEEGTHEELVRKGGEYSSIFEEQLHSAKEVKSGEVQV
jgi:ABC-type bacteriocin/lantibiotic exporter with double-glycine peptidase domain